MTDYLRGLLAAMRTPLRANAYALVANQALSAALGLVYWILAARLYGAETVGLSSAVISTLLLISGVAELGLSGGMVRFLPRAGTRTRRIIALSYAASIGTTALLSVAFLAFGGLLGLGGMLGDGAMAAFWVITAAVFRTIFRLQDAVLTGLKQARWVLIENTIYNVAKILILIAGVRLLANAGIVGSWFIPTPLVVALCTWLIFGVYTRRSRIAPAPAGATPLTVREIALSSGGDHVGSLVAEAASRALPLVVVAIAGAVANAYFYQAWLVAATWGLFAGSMTDSFIAEAAGDRANIGKYSRDILRQMSMLIIPAATIIALAAPLVLRLFGPVYAAEGTTLLRLLCLASPLVLFNTWYLAYERVIGRIRRVVWLQILSAGLLLALTYLLLGPLGINGVGVATIISQVPIALIGVLSTREVLFDSQRRGGAAA
jgi:O-antigen/teichoic acid export membrane protein